MRFVRSAFYEKKFNAIRQSQVIATVINAKHLIVRWPENSAGVGGLCGLIALDFFDLWLLCIKTK